jgi:MraZ protein
MTTRTASKTIFSSTFQHGVDAKRRVQVPAKWRPAESDMELTLVLWPKHKEGFCLRVLPPDQLDKLLDELDAMPNSDPNKVVLKRFIGSSSIQVALDKAGRICIPEAMAVEAGIEDEAILVGLLDRFEIWSPKRYQAVKASDAVIAQRAFDMME